MSVLSDVDIVSAYQTGDLEIIDFSDECLRSSSYLLRLHTNLLLHDANTSVIDTKSTDTFSQFKSEDIPSDGFILEPGRIYLGASHERVRLGRTLCGELAILSCYARIGLQLNFGSNFVAATYGSSKPSRLTFELINMSRNAIRIYSGVKFCHIRFSYHNSPCRARYEGIYAGGEDIVPANFALKPAR
jgi:dCTP deaminase